MKVVILAGGRGTRLGLSDRPKPMVLVSGRPLLERIVEVVRQSGFDDLIFLNGHLAEVIEGHFGDGSPFGVNITHTREATPLGTAGAVRQVAEQLSDPFIVLYGDILIEVDLVHLARVHSDRGGLATLFLHPNDHPFDSDLVEMDSDGLITEFHLKPHPQGMALRNLVSAAIYVVDPKAIDFIPSDRPSDWAHDVFPRLLAAGKPIYGYRSVEYAKDVGTPARLQRGEHDIESGRTRRLSRRNAKAAVFFDRDGVINEEIDGVHKPSDLVLLPGAAAAIRRVNLAGLPAFCATNQPGIAKGFMTENELDAVFAELDSQLALEHAYLDDVYFCPHHPDSGWPGEIARLKIDCACRKPKAGLLRRAATDHNIDLSQSWMIGDRYSDVACARAAGAKAVLVTTGFAGADRDRYSFAPDFVADTLSDAVSYVLGNIK